MKKFFAIVVLSLIVVSAAAQQSSKPTKKTGYVGTGIAIQFEEKHFSLYSGNNCADFNVSEEVVSEPLTFEFRSTQPERQTQLVKELFKIKGVEEVQLYPYKIRVVKADVFNWKELRPQIKGVLVKNIVPTPAKNK